VLAAIIKKMKTTLNDIDLALEKIVFLCNAEEGNPGIYELTWELSFYNLTVEEKYKIAHQLLTELLTERLVTLDKYTNYELKTKVETISLDKIDEVLNNPSNWYPCGEVLSITLTDKGLKYIDENIKNVSERLSERMRGKKN
jgi:hypothetical protein